MTTRAKATVRLKFSNQKQLNTLLCALKPEADTPVTRRVKINLAKEDSFLILTVEAEDTVALRATLNAYLRWINSTISIIDVVEQACLGKPKLVNV